MLVMIRGFPPSSHEKFGFVRRVSEWRPRILLHSVAAIKSNVNATPESYKFGHNVSKFRSESVFGCQQ